MKKTKLRQKTILKYITDCNIFIHNCFTSNHTIVLSSLDHLFSTKENEIFLFVNYLQ